ncbi:MAG: hypothetical protein ABR902_18930 [Candidatus Korobacteraceae bacterium]|jgi:hypothetical protein
MPGSVVKQDLRAVLDEHKERPIGEIRADSHRALYDFEKESAPWNEDEKHQPWSDDQLRVILSDAPTRDNALKHARAFRRGLGSVEQIYRWALQPVNVIEEKRPDHKFVQQVRRVSKELGWLS